MRTPAIEVATRCRVSSATVSAWSSGRKIPSERGRAALQAQYGISPASWDVIDLPIRS